MLFYCKTLWAAFLAWNVLQVMFIIIIIIFALTILQSELFSLSNLLFCRQWQYQNKSVIPTTSLRRKIRNWTRNTHTYGNYWALNNLPFKPTCISFTSIQEWWQLRQKYINVMYYVSAHSLISVRRTTLRTFWKIWQHQPRKVIKSWGSPWILTCTKHMNICLKDSFSLLDLSLTHCFFSVSVNVLGGLLVQLWSTRSTRTTETRLVSSYTINIAI